MKKRTPPEESLVVVPEDTEALALPEKPPPTTKDLIAALMSAAMIEVEAGNIKPRSVTDVVRVLKIEAQLNPAPTPQDLNAGDMLRQLGYIMDAVQNIVPQPYLHDVVIDMWRRGLDMPGINSLADVPDYQREWKQVDLNLAVRDYEMFGRTRTREELETNFQPPRIDGGGDHPTWQTDNDIPPD